MTALRLPSTMRTLWIGILAGILFTGRAPAEAPTGSEAALIGTLYDLKQTSQRKPTVMNAEAYDRIMAEFLTKGWDEHVLSRFYQVSHPLFTTQLFIPMIGDHEAPKLIGVGSRIKDGYWVAHFKGQVVPPFTGRFRFVGYAHATLFLAVNGKLVLNGSRFDIRQTMKNFPVLSAQKPSDPHGAAAGDWMLSQGSWVDVKAGEPIDLDILFGNRVYAELCAFLLVEREGETYPIDPATHYPILPLFQVAPYDGELFQGKLSTRCSVNSMIWKCLQ